MDTSGDKTISAGEVTLDLNGHKLHFTGGTNGFIVDGASGTSFTVTDSVKPAITEERDPANTSEAAYNAVRRILLYYTMDAGGIVTKHEVDMDACGGMTGDNTGIMIEVKSGVFNLEGGVLTHKVRAVESISKAANVINIRGGAVVGCGVAAGGTTVNGSGVGIYGGGTLNISGGYIGGNEATTRGGGIIIDSGRLNMTGGVLASNRTGTNGGAVYVNTGCTAGISGGVIASNYGGSQAGGIYVLGPSSTLTVSGDALLTMNSTNGNGGAVFSMAGWGANGMNTVNVSGGLFTGNAAGTGGAIRTGTSKNNGGALSITGGTFCYNTAAMTGGAVHAEGAVKGVTIENAVFRCNEAKNGGAICYADTAGTNTFANLTITGNHASDLGGGIYLPEGAKVALNDSTLQENTAGGHGGGVYAGGDLTLRGVVKINLNHRGEEANNLYLPAGKTVTLEETLGEGSLVGVTTEAVPAEGSPVVVASSTQSGVITGSLAAFRSDRAGCGPSILQDGQIVFALDASVAAPELQVQYYADVTALAETGDADRRLQIMDTSGRALPVNGVMPATRYLYLNEDGSVKMTTETRAVYRTRVLEKAELPSLQAMNAFSQDAGYYQVEELWVLKKDGDPESSERANWDIYPWSSELGLTADQSEADADPNTLYVGDRSAVRFVASPVTGTSSGPVILYDYDISDGNLYTAYSAGGPSDPVSVSEQAARDAAGETSIMYTCRSGINSDVNYGGSDTATRFAIGNGNIKNGYADNTRDGYSFNKANTGANHFNLCHFGLVTGLDGEGHLKYASGVSAPNLFNEGTAEGKTPYGNYSLNFIQTGGQYTLTSVGGLESFAGDLEFLSHPGGYTHIWTNHFWPMDGVDSYGTAGHDLRFGSSGLASSRKLWSSGISDLPVSDDGEDHNAYFGMQCTIAFTLDQDYLGPLEYTFFGNDDAWVFLDGQLVCDVGGIHRATGAHVDLWDYLDESDSGDHELKIFYLERGASGSTCWMQFSVPRMRVISSGGMGEPDPTGSLRIENTVEGGETAQAFTFTVTLDAEGAFPYTGSHTGTLSSGGSFTLADGEYILLSGLPAGARYTVTETPVKGYESTVTGETGTISRGQSTASFVNTALAPVGILKISKQVILDDGSLEEEDGASDQFRFTVFLKDGEGTPLEDSFPWQRGGSGETGAISSGMTVSLSGGEYIEILDLPAGTQYEVVEAETEGYVPDAASSGGSGVITAWETSEAAFVNRKLVFGPMLPRTGGAGTGWSLTLGVALMAAGGCLAVVRKRRPE